MFYSPKDNAFYPASLKTAYERAGTWPTDAVKISDEEFNIYFKEQPPAGKRLGGDMSGRPTWVEAPLESADTRRVRQLNTIDIAAGNARLRFVSAGQLIEEEYRQALAAVRKWRAAGSPSEAVPPEIQSGADYSGISAEDAAMEIEQTASQWESILAQIRDLRLRGKTAVNSASDDEIEIIAKGYIDSLEEMVPAF